MKYLPGLLLICLFFVSCQKDREGIIPDVYVNYRLTIQDFQIKNSNGVLIVNNQGIAGLVIYRRPDNTYVAYDRCSSVNPEQRCAVQPDELALSLNDPCSGAKFSLFDGSPVKAPAKRSLKQYSISISNFEILVRN